MSIIRIQLQALSPSISKEHIQESFYAGKADIQRFHGLHEFENVTENRRALLAEANIRKLEALLNQRQEQVVQVAGRRFNTERVGAFTSDKDADVASLLNRKVSVFRTIAKCLARLAALIPMVTYTAAKHGLYRAFGVDSSALRAGINQNLGQVLRPGCLVPALTGRQLQELAPVFESIEKNLNQPLWLRHTTEDLLPLHELRPQLRTLAAALKERSGLAAEGEFDAERDGPTAEVLAEGPRFVPDAQQAVNLAHIDVDMNAAVDKLQDMVEKAEPDVSDSKGYWDLLALAKGVFAADQGSLVD